MPGNWLIAVALLQSEPGVQAPPKFRDGGETIRSAGSQPGGTDPASVRPFEMPAVVPIDEPPADPVRAPTEAVSLQTYRGQYEPPEDVVQRRFERGVLESSERATSLAGPLEGAWRVTAAEGPLLYDLMLSDGRPLGGPVEGAWRDPSRPGALAASGVLDAVESATGATLTLRLAGAGARGPLDLIVRRASPSRYEGELWAGHGPLRRIVITRAD